jgi:hypothetical protein
VRGKEKGFSVAFFCDMSSAHSGQEGHMELVNYDEQTKTSTIKLTDWDLVDMLSLLGGVLNVRQDYTALGVIPERLRELRAEISRVLDERHPKSHAG